MNDAQARHGRGVAPGSRLAGWIAANPAPAGRDRDYLHRKLLNL
jgi:hypothetical protein